MSGENKEKEQIDCSCYARSRRPDGCPPIRNVTHPLRYYEFTQDEIKVLEECDKESFYHRCLPFSTLFASITYAAIRMGLLKRSPHFGAMSKVFVAAVLGHYYGRYKSMCTYDEKLRNLPGDSHLGNTMRNYYLEHNPPPPSNK